MLVYILIDNLIWDSLGVEYLFVTGKLEAYKAFNNICYNSYNFHNRISHTENDGIILLHPVCRNWADSHSFLRMLVCLGYICRAKFFLTYDLNTTLLDVH